MKIIETLQVKFDSQDNIVKVNNGDWMESLDLDTFEPANDLLGIRHDWDNRTIYVKSNSFKLISSDIIGLATYSVTNDNVSHIYIPLMRNYMDNSDVFDLEIKIEVCIPLHSYLRSRIKKFIKLCQRFIKSKHGQTDTKLVPGYQMIE